VLPAQRRQRREIAVVHRRPLPAQFVEGGHHLACVPHADRITDQAHAGRPVELPLVVTLLEYGTASQGEITPPASNTDTASRG
jgi:hypothetical protein